ncbi:RNA polymerase sigma factor [Chitinimonas sp.]|uniref:RNA polymerase sigma factor n=1 Tax=Chitinimonas sp. TaxID=1934313 RepID=UPI0035AE12BA
MEGSSAAQHCGAGGTWPLAEGGAVRVHSPPMNAAAPVQTDEALMLAYARGEAAAFEQLYARHRQGLYAFIGRQCPRRAWVDDLFQETWMSVVKAREGYAPTAAFRIWLFGIARNKLIDRIRRHEPALLADFVGPEEDDPMARLPDAGNHDPQAQLADKQLRQSLDAALRALPASQREAFLLREQAGMSLDEIASLTGVSMETAKSRLRYAVARLKAALAGGV